MLTSSSLTHCSRASLAPAPAPAAVYYGGSYYLGEFRGKHSWENFAASGALAGVGGHGPGHVWSVQLCLVGTGKGTHIDMVEFC